MRSVDICEQPDAHSRRLRRLRQARRQCQINQSLLEGAKALDINLSFTLKQALQQASQKEVRTRKRAQWLKRSREAIAAYNTRIECDGVAGDRVHAFRAKA